jgi:hypothetical protein
MPALWTGSVVPLLGATTDTPAPETEVPATPSFATNVSPLPSDSSMSSADLAAAPASPADMPLSDTTLENTVVAVMNAPDPAPLSAEATEALGQNFVTWLRAGLADATIALNETGAPVHTVAGGLLLVTPVIFKRFVAAHPSSFSVSATPDQPADANALLEVVMETLHERHTPRIDTEGWRQVQRAFQKLRLHEKHPTRGENIWRCRVQGARRHGEMKGFFLRDPQPILGDKRHADNVHLTLLDG